jgi:hypothetical protein
MDPVFVHQPVLVDERNYCEHVSSWKLTTWKYAILANFYLSAWIMHPTRPFRILWNAALGRETSPMEKFIGNRMRALAGRAFGIFQAAPARTLN